MTYDIATLDQLIDELHKAFETDVVDVDHVTSLMKSYKTNPADWKKFAKFDRYRYCIQIFMLQLYSITRKLDHPESNLLQNENLGYNILKQKLSSQCVSRMTPNRLSWNVFCVAFQNISFYQV